MLCFECRPRSSLPTAPASLAASRPDSFIWAGFIALFAGVLVTTAPAMGLAQESMDRPQNFVALGVGLGPEYLGSDDTEIIPFIAADYVVPYANLSIRGLSFSADVLGPLTASRVRGGTVIGGLVGNFRFGRDDVENDVVDRLAEVDDSFELGAFLGYRMADLAMPRDSFTVRVDALVDVTDGHGGFTVSPSLSYGFPILDRLRGDISASVDYGSEDFNQAFFEVTSMGAAASGLPVFSPDSGFYQAGFGLGLSYELTESWGVIGRVGYSRLLDDAADSPIVDDEGDVNQVFGGIAISYRF